MNTRVLTAHIPIPLAIKVDEVAARLERSRGWIIKQALSTWLSLEEGRQVMIQQPLAEGDTKYLADHNVIQS